MQQECGTGAQFYALGKLGGEFVRNNREVGRWGPEHSRAILFGWLGNQLFRGRLSKLYGFIGARF